MKKLIALLLAMALACGLLAGCSGSKDPQPSNDPTPSATTPAQTDEPTQPAEPTASDETLKVALSNEPRALFPQFATSNPSAVLMLCLYDTLVSYDEDNNPVPCLASSWEWIDDLHIRFTLNKDARFSDGSPVTAEDVLYTFQIGGTKNIATTYTRIFDVDNFVVEDDQNIVFALKMNYPTVMDIIGNYQYSILNKEATEAAGELEVAARSAKNGSGRYVFSSWKDGESITIERNEDYWNKDAEPCYYKTIVFTYITDATARALAVESGDVDIADELGATQVAGLEGNSKLNVTVHNTSTNKNFYMNCSKGPLANEKVREAIFYLLDANACRAIVNANYGETSETSFSHFCVAYAAPEAGYTREVNVEKAKALLAEAGYPDGFDLNFMIVSSTANMLLAEVIQDCLSKGGIDMKIDGLELGAYLARQSAGDYEATVTSGDQWDYAKLLGMLDGRKKPSECNGGAQYYSEELIDLIDKATYEQDYEKCLGYYAEIQKYVRDHYVVIGVYNEVRVVCTSAEVGELSFDMCGHPILTKAARA